MRGLITAALVPGVGPFMRRMSTEWQSGGHRDDVSIRTRCRRRGFLCPVSDKKPKALRHLRRRSTLRLSPPCILLNVVLARMPRNSNTVIGKGTHVGSVLASWRRTHSFQRAFVDGDSPRATLNQPLLVVFPEDEVICSVPLLQLPAVMSVGTVPIVNRYLHL
ncbi:hypothetical protein MTO96_038825 [Rhipicephalus appendiculatus]